MTKAVFPGSFDPFTHGHLEIVQRATAFFDEIVVGVAINSGKVPVLNLEQRLRIAVDAVGDVANVSVAPVPGLLVDFCLDQQANAIIKGLRGGTDLDEETPMALMNRHLTGIDTVFLIGSPQVAHIASSMVRDVARYGGDITDMVSPLAAQELGSALQQL